MEDKVQTLKNVGKINFIKRNISVNISEITEENGLLKVVVSATKSGKALKINNPLYYKNPPISTPDGTKSNALINGRNVQVDNYKTDAAEALKEIVTQTIELTNK